MNQLPTIPGYYSVDEWDEPEDVVHLSAELEWTHLDGSHVWWPPGKFTLTRLEKGATFDVDLSRELD